MKNLEVRRNIFLNLSNLAYEKSKQKSYSFCAHLCMAHFLYTSVRAPIVIPKKMMPANIFFQSATCTKFHDMFI